MSKGNRGGRKPKPRGLHLVDASFRPDRHGNRKKAEESVRDAKSAPVPTAPAFLSPSARAEWKRLAAILHARGDLERADRAALAAYCQAYGELRDAESGVKANLSAEREVLKTFATVKDPDRVEIARAELARQIIANGGRLSISRDGVLVQHPAVKNANSAARRLRDFACEFGMTPVARTRLGHGDAGAPEEDFPEGTEDAPADAAGA